MRRKIFFLTLALALLMWGNFWGAGGELRAQNLPEFYAYMHASSSWGGNGTARVPKYGFYRISTDANGNASFTRLTNDATETVTDGAIYVDGTVYGVWTEVIKSFLGTYKSAFLTLDGETLAQKSKKESQNANLYGTSMTYDYITHTAFLTAPDGYASAGNPEVDYFLKRVDLTTGECTTVGAMGAQVKGLAADATGVLWGVGLSSGSVTNLYKINKETGAAQIYKKLNINYFGGVDRTSLMCDLRTGKLYLCAETYEANAAQERTFTYGIYELNPATGVATLVSRFPSEELFVAGFLRNAHPAAPAEAEAVSFDFVSGSTSRGHVSFRLPEKTFSGSALQSQNLTAEITLDGTTSTVESLTAGANYVSEEMELAAGATHTLKVVIRNASGPSLPVKVEVFAGHDTPSAPTNITVEESENGATATVRWTPPTVGTSGGFIDTAALTYRITRKPENILLVEGLTTPEYVDHIDRVMGVTQYQIEAVIGEETSASAYSAICTLGMPHPVPYLQTFGSYADWMAYKVIDQNGDANDDTGGTWYYDASNQVVMFFTNQKSADDYLISPTLALDPSKVYRLQFQAWGYHDNNSWNHLKVHLSKGATTEQLTTTILDERFNHKQQAYIYGLFRPSEGDCRLAFHNVSDVVKDGGFDHLFLDNIYLQEYGTVKIAAEPTDLVGTRLASGQIRVRFKAPTTCMDGTPIGAIQRMEVSMAGSFNASLAQVENPVAGEEYEVVFTPTVAGECTFSVNAVTQEGRGMEAYVVVDTRNDVPAAPTAVRVEGKNAYTIAEVHWEQNAVGEAGHLINLDDISYTIYRFIGVHRTLLAEGVKGLTYTDRGITEALGETQQDYVTYAIVPETDGGKGAEARSEAMLLGRSYELPFAESFSARQFQTQTWRATNMKYQGGSWSIAGTGYDPFTQAQDADEGLMTFLTSYTYPVGQSDFLSPRIDVSNYSSPTVTFYVYRSSAYTDASTTLQAGVYTPETGAVMLSKVINAASTTDGWERVEMTIPEPYALSDHLQLAFCAYTASPKACLHLDNISIQGTRPEHEVKAERITGADECVIGQENTYTVQVRNAGSQPCGPITVSLRADGHLLGTTTVETLAASDLCGIPFVYKPALGEEIRTVTLTAEISCPQDASTANNVITTTVDLIAPMLPRVVDLRAEADADAGKVMLRWSDNTQYPRQEYVTETCESLTPFAIQNMGGWTTFDGDGAHTIQTSLDGTHVLEWDNSGDPQAWIVFNTHRSGMEGYATAHSGTQCFVSFESTAAAGNDDWLISPQLSGEAQTLTFYAKAFYPYLLDEAFEVWASRSVADDVSRFECISGTKPVSVSAFDEWGAFRFALPEGTRYVAIRCVSKSQYGLMLDDITYSPAHAPLEFWGYNVYRDGVLLTPEPIADPQYVDETFNPATSSATYHVTALYAEGESIFSNGAKVGDDPDGVHSVSLSGAQKRAGKYLRHGEVYILTPSGVVYTTKGVIQKH